MKRRLMAQGNLATNLLGRNRVHVSVILQHRQHRSVVQTTYVVAMLAGRGLVSTGYIAMSSPL